jgi:hypothetical protein
MTKKLNVDNITNELEGSVFFPGRNNGNDSPAEEPQIPLAQEIESSAAELVQTSARAPRRQTKRADEQRSRSLNRSTNRLTRQSITQLTEQLAQSPMPKPKGFYISEQLDARLDHAVRYFQTVHGIKKVDRSILMNAMLIDETHWTEESLDQLTDRLIDQLTRRLTGR